MCYIILPVVAFILVLWTTISAFSGVMSFDWWVSPTGGYGIASGCVEKTTVNTPVSFGDLNSLDQNSASPDALSVTYCKNFSWGYLNGTTEQALAGLCFVAGGLGIIIMILIILEVLFRCCFKPHPVVPRLAALLAFCQFIAAAAICILFAGHYSFKPPAGFSIGLSYYMMMISIATSFAAAVIMFLAAKSEKKRYQKRFGHGQHGAASQPPKSADTLQSSAQLQEKNDISMSNIKSDV